MNKIRYYRKKCGYSIRRLSELTGVHYVSICRYELGKTVPSIRNLIRLSEALGCSVSDLIETNGAKTA